MKVGPYELMPDEIGETMRFCRRGLGEDRFVIEVEHVQGVGIYSHRIEQPWVARARVYSGGNLSQEQCVRKTPEKAIAALLDMVHLHGWAEFRCGS